MDRTSWYGQRARPNRSRARIRWGSGTHNTHWPLPHHRVIFWLVRFRCVIKLFCYLLFTALIWSQLAQEEILSRHWQQRRLRLRFCTQWLQEGDGFLPTGASCRPRGSGEAKKHERADEATGWLLRADGEDWRAYAEGDVKWIPQSLVECLGQI